METIQGIYIALFGRPADPSGLAYFTEVTKNGADLSAIGNLAGQPEYQARFTGMSNEEIINSIYQSLFGRDGEAEGVNFFLSKLADGTFNINNIAIAILQSAQGDDLATVQAKIAAASIFTVHLDQQVEIDAYAGTFAASVGRDFINSVNKDDAGTPDEADAAILRLFNQGQNPDNGGAPGGGNAGGGNVFPSPSKPTFTIIKASNEVEETAELVFGGSAKGDITLGQTSGEGESFLTGLRAGVNATFPQGNISVGEDGVDLDAFIANIILENGLRVTANAGEANGFSISGDGSVTITGSDASQNLIITAEGHNSIAGGQGADTISLGAGNDTIIISSSDPEAAEVAAAAGKTLKVLKADEDGLEKKLAAAEKTVADDTSVADLEKAEKALQALRETKDGLDAALKTAEENEEEGVLLQGKVDTAETDLATAQKKALDASEAAKPFLAAVNAAETKYDAAVLAQQQINTKLAPSVVANELDNIKKAFDADASSGQNRTQLTAAIEASTVLPAELKTALKAELPQPIWEWKLYRWVDTSFDETKERSAYINKAGEAITTYLRGFETATAAANSDLIAKQAAYAPYKNEVSNLELEVTKASGAVASAEATLKEYLTDLKVHSVNDLAQAVADANEAITEYGKQLAAADIEVSRAKEAVTNLEHLKDLVVKAHDALEVNQVEQAKMQGVIDAAKEIVNDSHVGAEDIIKNFDIGHDRLDLPGHDVVSNVVGAAFGEGEHGYSIEKGVLKLSDSDTVLSKELVAILLNHLANDDVVADGETVVFQYDEDGIDGANDLYVFQGHAGKADLGVKLIGVSADSLENGAYSLVAKDFPPL